VRVLSRDLPALSSLPSRRPAKPMSQHNVPPELQGQPPQSDIHSLSTQSQSTLPSSTLSSQSRPDPNLDPKLSGDPVSPILPSMASTSAGPAGAPGLQLGSLDSTQILTLLRHLPGVFNKVRYFPSLGTESYRVIICLTACGTGRTKRISRGAITTTPRRVRKHESSFIHGLMRLQSTSPGSYVELHLHHDARARTSHSHIYHPSRSLASFVHLPSQKA